MSQSNLSSEIAVFTYLTSKFPSYSPTRVDKVSGGNTNFTFRVFLKSPLSLDGQIHPTVFLKHAAPYSATNRSFALTVQRQDFEVAALRYANNLFGVHSLAKAPILLEHDQENHVIIMTDAGVGSRTLKDLLISNDLAPGAAERVGRSLGEFLSTLHEHGRSTPERKEFSDRQWARQIGAWVTHGRVIETLNENIVQPPIELSESELNEVKSNTTDMINLFQNSEETIIMGDFWTGNVIVKLQGSGEEQQVENILVADWEISRLGTPGNDVGQFAAEIYLPQFFYPACTQSSEALIKAFCSAYKAGIHNLDESVHRNANRQMGSHFIAIATRVLPWREDKAKTRGIAEEGVSLLTGRTTTFLAELL